MPCLPLVIIAVLVVTMLAPHVTGGQSEDTVPAGELSGPQGSDTIEATAGGPATGVLGPETRARHAELNRLWQQATEFRQVGRPADAIPPVERVLVIERQLFGEIHEEIALTLEALVDLHDQAGDLDAAEQVARERLRVIIGLVGARHWRATDARLAISRLAAIKDLTPQDRERINEGRQFQERAIRLYSSGRYAEAEPLFKQALEVYRATLGEVYPDYVAGVTHLARLYSATGRDAAAELLYRRALEITEAALGEEHPDCAAILNNLAALYQSSGRYAEAEPLLKEALEVYKRALGEDDPRYATSLNNLARLHWAAGRYAEAEPLYRRALEITEAAFGEEHPDYAVILDNLSALYWATGRYAKAEPLCRRALEVRRAALGEEHPDHAQSLSNLALLYQAIGRYAEAADLFDRTRRSHRRLVAAVLRGLSEREQLTFLGGKGSHQLFESLSLPLSQPGVAGLAARSAAWLVNGKGLAAEALAERARLAVDSADPAAAAAVQELAAVRAGLARLTLAGPGPEGPQPDQARTAELSDREAELSKALFRFRGEDVRPDPWVGLEEVRAALPADALLIEFAWVLVAEEQGSGGAGARYAAWVIPPAGAGDVRLVDLGPAEPIEDAVAAAHRAAGGAAEPEAAARLAAVSELVLGPLGAELSGAERWYVSPDAALWLVPFCALPLSDGRYVVEAHEVTLLTSGRELVTGRRTGAGPRAAGGLLVADPDFDADPGPAGGTRPDDPPVPVPDPPVPAAGEALPPALPETIPLPPGETVPAPAEDTPAAGGDAGRGAAPRRFTPLPGTAAEADRVKPVMADYLGVEPQALLGEAATESAVKAAARPRALVLATHGFAVPSGRRRVPPAGDWLAARGLTPSGRERIEPASAGNPLLWCGVALAGANALGRADGERGGPAEDGVLTGLEVAGLDLRGTELVVLSACQTGLGDVRTGEGVADLRHAFRLAGARAVVASLWEVPDAETADLMARFWEELAAGEEPAAALRAAQLGLLEDLREQGDARPALWAAFSVTGRAGAGDAVATTADDHETDEDPTPN